MWDPNGKRWPVAQGLRASGLPSMAWLDQSGLPNGPKIRALAMISEAGTRKLFGGSLPPKSQALSHYRCPSVPLHTTRKLAVECSRVLRGLIHGCEKNTWCTRAHADHLGIGKPINGDTIYNRSAG